jgi:hypothetical protein
MIQRPKEKDRLYKGQKKRTDDTKAKRKGPDDTKANRKGQMIQRPKKGPDDTKVKRKGQRIQRSKEKDGWYKGQKKRTDDTKAK